MKLNNDILERAKKIWPNNLEEVLQKYEEKEEKYALFPEMIKEKMGTPEEQFIHLLEAREATREWELKVVKTIIPKDQLKDEVTYVAMEGTEKLCRHVNEARWDAKKEVFWYWRNKFGFTFEDSMDHFVDAIEKKFAGFTPIMEKKDVAI